MGKFFNILLLLVLFMVSSLEAQNIQQQKDSLRNVISQSEGKEKLSAYMSLLSFYSPDVGDLNKRDTLFILFDEVEEEAIRLGAMNTLGMVYGNRIIAFKNCLMYDEVIRRAPDVLDFYLENEFWIYYYQINHELINAYNQTENYEKAIEEAEKMYNMARSQKDEGGIATALFATANIYNLQGRYEEQEQCLREALEIFWRLPLYLNKLTSTYGFLCISLRKQKRYDEIFQIIPDFERAVILLEQNKPTTNNMARRALYITLMNNYVDTGQYEKAGIYIKKLENKALNEIERCDWYRANALFLQSRKEYRQALSLIDSALQLTGHVAYNHNLSKKIKVMILAQMGDTHNAMKLFEEVLETNRSIHDVEVNARFDELRTQYEVDKHIAEKERNRNYYLFALGGCALLFLLLGCTVLYNRVIARKNRKLFLQIKQQDSLEMELARLRSVNLPEPAVSDIADLPGDRNQRELVGRLKEHILNQRNPVDTELNRDEFISALGTNRNTLSDAVKAVTGRTFMEYVRFLQLEEARRKLELHPELTVEAIAYDCGSNALNTFYRQFRKHYGISPAEYRKISDSMRE